MALSNRKIITELLKLKRAFFLFRDIFFGNIKYDGKYFLHILAVNTISVSHRVLIIAEYAVSGEVVADKSVLRMVS